MTGFPKTVSGLVGPFNTSDYYSLVLTATTSVNLDLTASSGASTLTLYNGNDGVVTSRGASTSSDGWINEVLQAGTYYVSIIDSYNSDSAYLLMTSLGSPVVGTPSSNNGGSSLSTAVAAGTLTASPEVFLGYLGTTSQATSDWYSFTVSTISQVSITLSGLATDTSLYLTNASGQTIADTSGTSTSNASLIDQLQTLAAGSYYIEVESPSYPTGFNLSVAATAIPEPAGETQSTAEQIGLLTSAPRSFTGSLNSAQTASYYAFTVATASSVNFTLSGLSNNAYLYIFDASGNQVGSEYGGGYNDNASLIAELSPLLANTTYYVEVSGAGDTSYTLSASAAAIPDGAGNTNAAARAVGALTTTPITFSDSVGPTDPVDEYEIVLTSATTLNILLSAYSNFGNTYSDVTLYDGSGNVYGQGIGTSSLLLTSHILQPGTYFAEITPNYSFQDADYQVSFSVGTSTIGGAAVTPGISMASATNVGTLTSTTSSYDIAANQTADFYRFTLAAPSLIDLVVTGQLGSTTLILENASGDQVGSSYGVYQDTTDYTGAAISQELAAGIYYIDVSEVGASYVLSASASAVPAIAGGTLGTADNIGSLTNSVQTFTGFVGQVTPTNDFEFTLSANSRVTLLLSGIGVTGSATLNLENISGTSILSEGASYTSNASVLQTLTAGTYFVSVTSSNATDYILTASAAPVVDDAGATLGTAASLGVACFASGTRISTIRGEVPVEELRLGDTVVLASGKTAPIRWIGHRHIDCRAHPTPADVWPVRVCTDAFRKNVPKRDLLLSPDHAIFHNGILIPIKYLINDTTILRAAQPSVTYWHIELDRHDVLLAEGLACESYLDTGNRTAFANGHVVTQLFPAFSVQGLDEAFWEAAGCAPLRIDGPVVTRLASRLRRRGGILDAPPVRPVSGGRCCAPTASLEKLLRSGWYLSVHQDVAAFGLDPMTHYRGWGRQEGRLPCPEEALIRGLGMLDPLSIACNMGDVIEAGIDPVVHYCTEGWRELRQPNAYFNTSWYLSNHDVPAGMNPLLHYVLFGEPKGLAPSTHFDPIWYYARYALGPTESALAHFLIHRRSHRVSPLKEFDLTHYIQTVKALLPNRDPYTHHLVKNWGAEQV